MKTYGLIVADNGTDMFISGTWDDRWDNDVLNPAFDQLTASDFEVVQLGWNPPVAPALSVDAHPGGSANQNGVLEPGETVVVSPSWQRPSTGRGADRAPSPRSGVPPARRMRVADASAAYGSPAADTPAECWTATADCYRALGVARVTASRGALGHVRARDPSTARRRRRGRSTSAGTFADAPPCAPVLLRDRDDLPLTG